MGEKGPKGGRLRASATPEGERHPETNAVRNASQAPARPTVEQAMGATRVLSDFYGMGSQFDTAISDEDLERYFEIDLPNSEVVQRLSDLARGIQAGGITSHRDVSRAIFSLGASFGPFGTVSAEANEAAYYAAMAVRQHQRTFSDNAEVAAKIVARK